VVLEITDTETGSVVYENTFDLARDEELATPDVVGKGEYDVQVVIDGEQELSKIIITIREPGESRITKPKCM
jgi:hypothetical protein